jgi:hypothetical protein
MVEDQFSAAERRETLAHEEDAHPGSLFLWIYDHKLYILAPLEPADSGTGWAD